MQYQFPENFWWGSASSAPQTEGAAFEDGKAKTFGTFGTRMNPTVFSMA